MESSQEEASIFNYLLKYISHTHINTIVTFYSKYSIQIKNRHIIIIIYLFFITCCINAYVHDIVKKMEMINLYILR